jgi:hypothetical protein
MNEQSGGIGVIGALGIVFIVLKLTNVIDWSWWWVLAPFWIPLAISLIFLLILFILTFLDKR